MGLTLPGIILTWNCLVISLRLILRWRRNSEEDLGERLVGRVNGAEMMCLEESIDGEKEIRGWVVVENN